MFLCRYVGLGLLGLAALSAGCEDPIFHPELKKPQPANDKEFCFAPRSVSGVEVVVTETQVELRWQEGGGGQDGFIVERRLFLDPTWGELTQVEGDVTSYVDASDLMLDAQYGYRITAFRGNTGCTAEPSEEAVGTTLPKAAQEARAEAYADRIELTWRDPNDFETGYLVERRRQQYDRSFHAVAELDRNEARFEDRDLEAGEIYDYLIFAVNNSGRSQPVLVSAPVLVSTRAPYPPSISWRGEPSLDVACQLSIPTSASFDSELEALYDEERSFASVDRIAQVTVVEEPAGSGNYVISGLLQDLSLGAVDTKWTVFDSLDGQASLERELYVGQTSSMLSRARLPSTTLGDDDMAGRQIMLPGCSNCYGQRGSMALGREHSCVLDDQGGVRCWGYNLGGQIGNGISQLDSNIVKACSGRNNSPCTESLSNIRKIALGDASTCAVLQDGVAKCWGSNNYGRVGVGWFAAENYNFPREVCHQGSIHASSCQPLPFIRSIDSGSAHACAVDESGQVYCWGGRGYGRLGIGHKDEAPNPEPVCSGDLGDPCGSQLTGIDQVVAGIQHSCAKTTSGGVKCWGYNDKLALGIGSDDSIKVFTPLDVCAQGSYYHNNCVPLRNVVSIDSGDYHVCALLQSGQLHCWGYNSSGVLGSGTLQSQANPAPVCASGSRETEDCVPLTNVTTFSMGEAHTCAVANGDALCWGEGDYGRLGNGTDDNSSIPTPICLAGEWNGTACVNVIGTTFDTLSGVTNIAAGDQHTCAVVASGAVRCWGENYYGQLGDGDVANYDEKWAPSPVCASGSVENGDCVELTGAEALGLGVQFSCAKMLDGGVKCWGDGDYGLLGDGDPNGHYTSNPTDVCATGSAGTCVPLANVQSIEVGSNTSCAMTDQGTRCWGANSSHFRLGDGTEDDRFNPVPLCASGKTNEGCVELQAVGVGLGWDHGCAFTASGDLYCWGETDYGRLGTIWADTVLNPVPVCAEGRGLRCVPLTGAVSVSVGDGFSCALMTGGGVKCWGYNSSNALGDGTSIRRDNPVDVCASGEFSDGACTGSALQGVVSLSAGDSHVCALLPDETVVCWGSGYALGNLDNSNSSNPVAVCDGEEEPCTTLQGVTHVSSGYGFSCARLDTGRVKCWGGNQYGQIGDGTKGTTRTGAVEVCTLGYHPLCIPLEDALDVAVGEYHTCARVQEEGSVAVKCWGANTSGQLGDGGEEIALNPVDVCQSGSVAGEDCQLLTGGSALAAGASHSCVILDSGEMACWGDSGAGQLGSGSGNEVPLPNKVCASGSGAECVPQMNLLGLAAGAFHTCGLTESGTARCWGSGFYGQLGNGELAFNSAAPVDVCKSGTTVDGSCELLTRIVAISAAGWNTCALLDTGEAVCWGENGYGQVGNGIIDYVWHGATEGFANPVPVCESGRGNDCTPLTDLVSIEVGLNHSCAMTAQGTLKCWGLNEAGQLGDGTQESGGCEHPDYIDPTYGDARCRLLPVDVCDYGNGPGCAVLQGVRSVTLGERHSCAVTSQGQVRCWGANNFGQLGDGTTVDSALPQTVRIINAQGNSEPLTNVLGIAANYDSTCAVLASGEVYCWGNNYWGQLGEGRQNEMVCVSAIYYHSCSPYPLQVCDGGLGRGCDQPCDSHLSGVVGIAGGGNHFCVLTDNNQMKCWGDGYEGQLGNASSGESSNFCTPTEVCLGGWGRGCNDGLVLGDTALMSCDLAFVTAN